MMRIVLFETEKTLIEQLSTRCEKSGVTLLVYSDLAQTFEAVKKEPDLIDVVLIAREMPGSDDVGFQLAHKLRSDAKTAEVPFIIFSSKLSNSEFARHQKGDDGANAYLKKPINVATLVSTMETVTGMKFPAEKKAVKKAPPKPVLPGINVTLVETKKILNFREPVPSTVTFEVPLVFFAEEFPVSASEIEEAEKQSTQIEMPAPEVETPAVAEQAVNFPNEAPVAAPAPSAGGGIEIDLSAQPSGGLEIELNSGEAMQASAPATEPAPVAPQEPFEVGEISLNTSIQPVEPLMEAPAPVSEPAPEAAPELEAAPEPEIDLSAPASFDANAAAPLPAAPTEPAEIVTDDEVAQDLPYLFGATQSAVAGTSAVDRSVNLQMPEGNGDIETLKKYLMMREQDIAILSAQLSYAKEELGKGEQSIKRLNQQIEDQSHQIHDRDQRIDTLEKELMHASKSRETELEQIKFELKAKIDRSKFLEDQLQTSALQYDKLKDRVRQDIRKIRVRERELENKLEILKKDSETLIAARESKILELKRKIDLLEFNYDTLQDQNEAEKANVAQAHEKIAKVVKVLKLAMGIIEGETEGGKTPDENDVKAA